MVPSSVIKSTVLVLLCFSGTAYSQQTPSQSPRVARRAGPPPIGTFTNGRFHHTLTGTEFSLPAGWTITHQGQSSGDGEQVAFALADGSSEPVVQAFVWMKSETRTPDEIPDELRWSVAYKAGMREGEGIPNYKMLTNTIERKFVGGQQALSALAQFDQGNVKMIEYNTWAVSEKTRVYISARVRAADLAGNRARIDQVLDSLLVP